MPRRSDTFCLQDGRSSFFSRSAAVSSNMEVCSALRLVIDYRPFLPTRGASFGSPTFEIRFRFLFKKRACSCVRLSYLFCNKGNPHALHIQETLDSPPLSQTLNTEIISFRLTYCSLTFCFVLWVDLLFVNLIFCVAFSTILTFPSKILSLLHYPTVKVGAFPDGKLEDSRLHSRM